MKKTITHFLVAGAAMFVFNLGSLYAQDQTVSGNLIVTGTADLLGNTLNMGSLSGTSSEPGMALIYVDGTMAGINFIANRSAAIWQWSEINSGSNVLSMKLNQNNQLILYSGTSAGIILNPSGTSSIIGSLTIGGTNNTLPNQMLSGSSSILTETLADGRYLSLSAAAGYLTQSAGDGRYVLQTGSTIVIGSGGDVGIGTGTTGLSHAFEVNGDVSFDRGSITSDGSGNMQANALQGSLRATSNNYPSFGDGPGVEVVYAGSYVGGVVQAFDRTNGVFVGLALVGDPLTLNRDGGNVGIGLYTPAYTLDVAGDINFTGNLYQNGVAFAAGGGTLTIAGGSVSNGGLVALGTYAQATGQDSFAFGDYANASGDYSFASGNYSTASGDYSKASGYESTASGNSSSAIGYGSTASGDYSIAIGYASTASGPDSVTLGPNSTSSAQFSTAIGEWSFAVGSDSTAIGPYSYAGGQGAIASGGWSTASGDYSIAAGMFSSADGDYSVALGYTAETEGQYSTAIGYTTTAGGDIATSLGNTTIAQGFSQLVIGQFNIPQGDANNWVATDDLLEIGNGTDQWDLSNALVVKKNGETDIYSTADPTTPVIVLDPNNAQITVNGQPYGGSWATSGSNVILSSGYVGIDTGTNQPQANLDVNGSAHIGGNTAITGTMTAGSLAFSGTGGSIISGTGNVNVTGTSAATSFFGNSANFAALTTSGTITAGALTFSGTSGTIISGTGNVSITGTSSTSNLVISGTSPNPNKIGNGGLIVTGTAVTSGTITTIVSTGTNQLVLIPQQGDLSMGAFTAGALPQ